MSIYDRGSFQSVLMVALQAIYSAPSTVTGFLNIFTLIHNKHFTTTLNIHVYDRNNLYRTTLITVPKVLWSSFLWIGQVHCTVLAVEYHKLYGWSRVKNLNDCFLGDSGKQYLSDYCVLVLLIRMPHLCGIFGPLVLSL